MNEQIQKAGVQWAASMNRRRKIFQWLRLAHLGLTLGLLFALILCIGTAHAGQWKDWKDYHWIFTPHPVPIQYMDNVYVTVKDAVNGMNILGADVKIGKEPCIEILPAAYQCEFIRDERRKKPEYRTIRVKHNRNKVIIRKIRAGMTVRVRI